MTISLETLKERNNNLINRLLSEFEKMEGGTSGSTILSFKNDETKLDESKNISNEISQCDSPVGSYSDTQTELKTELKVELRDFWLSFHKQVKSEFYNEAEAFKVTKNGEENILDMMIYKLVLHHLMLSNTSENEIESFIDKQKCQFIKKELSNYVKKYKKAERMKKYLSQGDFKAVTNEIEDIITSKSANATRFIFCVNVLDYLDEIFLFISGEIKEKDTGNVYKKKNSDDKLRFLGRIRILGEMIENDEDEDNSEEIIGLAQIIIKQPLDEKLLRNLPIDIKTDESSILIQIRRLKQLYHKEATIYISDMIYEELQIPIGDPILNLFKAGCTGLRVLCENEIFKETVLFSKEQLKYKCPETDCLIHSGKVLNKITNNIQSPLGDSDHEIPIELPFSEQHHSIIICPVLKTPCDKLNPPLVLECLHVISREAVKRLNTVKGVFDCPYCPKKSDINSVFEIFYE